MLNQDRDNTIENTARGQAKMQLAGVIEMVKELRAACSEGDEKRIEKAEKVIEEDPVEVCVRSGWQPVGNTSSPEIDEYSILLCGGGPAVSVTGNLNAHGTPDDAKLEYRDWFERWTEYETTEEEKEYLVEYADQFYYE